MIKFTLLLIVLTLKALISISQNKVNNKFYEGVNLYELQANPTLNKFIEDWHGTPYRLGGTNKRGIDCSQFNKRLYKDVYNKDLENIAEKQWKQTIRISKNCLEVGDLVFFRSTISPSRWHTGVYIGNTFFVHASNKSNGVKISSLEEERYKNSVRGYGRLK